MTRAWHENRAAPTGGTNEGPLRHPGRGPSFKVRRSSSLLEGCTRRVLKTIQQRTAGMEAL